MKDYIDQLARSVLKKDSLADCSLQELKKLAEDHPYFAAAQLLLAKKLKIENSASYQEQVEKTSLFFNNPFWLDQLLNGTGDAVIVSEAKQEEKPDLGISTESKQEEKIEITSETKQEITPSPEPQTSNFEPQASNPQTSKPLFQLPNPQTPPITEFTFEPYHTVDYFASQGIRFKEEEKPADKFGQQLKSFTEWLKTLKRLPVSEVVKQTSPGSEQKVDQLAEDSLADREVITEAMAEVWIKQGNPEKAIDIYEKLSLSEPAKSAYFAAKIEGLKQ